MQFPIIDLESISAVDPDATGSTAREIDQALSSVGFMAIVNHGVTDEIIAAAWQSARLFFDLPLEQKMQVHSDDPDYPYGYAPMADEALGEDSRPDPKESFNLGPPPRPEVEAAGGYRLAERLWPASPASFEASWLAYYEAMDSLAGRLMQLFAIGLGLEVDFFDDKIDRHLSALRSLNYPEHENYPEDVQIRAGAHTDYGTLTILRPDDTTAGLQVATASGEWLSVPKVPNGFIINTGDLMAMWTNDRWRSTLHRVVTPSQETCRRRQSMAFFHQPNWDAAIECLPSCTDADHPPAYPPTHSGPWLRARVEAAHDLDSG